MPKTPSFCACTRDMNDVSVCERLLFAVLINTTVFLFSNFFILDILSSSSMKAINILATYILQKRTCVDGEGHFFYQPENARKTLRNTPQASYSYFFTASLTGSSFIKILIYNKSLIHFKIT